MTLYSAFIGLGSNLASPEDQIRRAITELAEHEDISVIKCSSLYTSKPLAGMAQPDYVNAVAMIETQLSAERLLAVLQYIEDLHGRDKQAGRWSARTLDLDILLFDNQTIATEQLTIPHYGLKERNFVLYPLAELDPNLKLPDNTKLTTLLEQCSEEGLVRIE